MTVVGNTEKNKVDRKTSCLFAVAEIVVGGRSLYIVLNKIIKKNDHYSAIKDVMYARRVIPFTLLKCKYTLNGPMTDKNCIGHSEQIKYIPFHF